MFLISLQSGSHGNCVYVESGDVRLLFDAGLSPTQVEERLSLHGRDPQSVNALLVSHNHWDHVRFAGSYTRRFGIPLYITEKTLVASHPHVKPAKCGDIEYFRAGDSVKIGHVTVETICTPHDAVDGVVFVVDDGKSRLGICTDVGHVFQDLRNLVSSVDGLFLESNFDDDMLLKGSYPQKLKDRIRGEGGHISNREAAELVASNAKSNLRWLCLAHLSDKNNTKRKALAAHRDALGDALPIQVTSRHRATEILKLGEGAHEQLLFDFSTELE